MEFGPGICNKLLLWKSKCFSFHLTYWNVSSFILWIKQLTFWVGKSFLQVFSHHSDLFPTILICHSSSPPAVSQPAYFNRLVQISLVSSETSVSMGFSQDEVFSANLVKQVNCGQDGVDVVTQTKLRIKVYFCNSQQKWAATLNVSSSQRCHFPHF